MLRCRMLLGPPDLIIYESPTGLEQALNPNDLADIIAWLRQ